MNTFLIAIFLCLLCAPILLYAQSEEMEESYHLLIGTYTSGKSEGVYVYRFNSITGELTHEHTAKGIANPSFVIVSPDQQFAYAVNEQSGESKGMVSAFHFNPANGSMELINQQPSGGGDPCYLSLSPSGRHLFVGNYTGGSVSVLPVQPNGALEPAMQTIIHEGSSVNKSRQEKGHVHSTVVGPEGDKLFVGDLGTDKVYTYLYNPQAKQPLQPADTPFTGVEPGKGPRHLVFNRKGTHAYLVQELNASIAVFRYENGKLQQIQSIPMAAQGFEGEQSGAEVRFSPDEKFLYASNRGEANEITVFAVDQNKGTLTAVSRQSTLGETPRNFIIDPSGRFLLVANQNSHAVRLFKRDPESGLLQATNVKLEVGSPVYLHMTPVNN